MLEYIVIITHFEIFCTIKTSTAFAKKHGRCISKFVCYLDRYCQTIGYPQAPTFPFSLDVKYLLSLSSLPFGPSPPLSIRLPCRKGPTAPKVHS